MLKNHLRNVVAIFTVALMLLATPLAYAQSYAGHVAHVVDGDTVDVVFKDSVTVAGKKRVRLVGIDTMESGDNEKLRKDEQKLGVNRHILLYWGQTAKKRLEQLVGGKDVIVTFPAADKVDRYGRLLGRLHLNGNDVNLQLVNEGLAMVYRKSSFSDKHAYFDAERAALSQRNGFWGHPAFGEVPAKLHISRR